ncbi:MAG: hypothetical protein JW801_03575 [Bacteroidales bacterium]|nr:hypothetical protein [Bacteroidales bacterium]
MRGELERTARIESYLLGELSSADRQQFEQEMQQDAALAGDVEAQKILMERIRMISFRKNIQAAHKRFHHQKGISFRNSRFNGILIGVAGLVLIGLITYQLVRKPRVTARVELCHYIQPPIPAADVPFRSDTIDAGTVNILRYETGSMLLIPDSAFVDSKGNPVEGNVEIKFREFTDVFDIYLSGIPMEYTTDSGSYFFESASMCEVYATQKGKELKLKPGKEIEIVQASYTTREDFDLYRFDKKQGSWIGKGKDRPVEPGDLQKLKRVALTDREEDAAGYSYPELEQISRISQPFIPKKARPGKVNFSIAFEENEFPELAGFENVLFEIDESVKPFQEGDDAILWENVRIAAGKKSGSYRVTFTKLTQNLMAEYTAFPVFEEDDWEKALKTYNQKLDDYNRSYKDKVDQQQELIDLRLAKQEGIDSVNRAIETRNRKISKQRGADSSHEAGMAMYQQVCELNAKRLAILRSLYTPSRVVQRLIADQYSENNLLALHEFIETEFDNMLKREKEAFKTMDAYNKVMRTYSIDGFGIWNTDTPSNLPSGMTLSASFSAGEVSLSCNINLIDKNRRAVYQYPVKNHHHFRYNPLSDNLLWTVTQGKLYYFNSFNDIPPEQNNREFTFEMSKVDKPLTSYKEVKALLEDL